MSGFKTIFKRINGRVIPMRISLSGAPDEIQKMIHKQKAMQALRTAPTEAHQLGRKLTGAFYKSSKMNSKAAGVAIAKRISKLKKLGF